MKHKYFKNGFFYIFVALAIMALLFFSSSQTYEQQTTVPLLEKLLKSQPFKSDFEKVSFLYAGSNISVAALGYSKFIEFFIRKSAHFGIYFLLGGSWFLGLRKRMNNNFLTLLIAWLAATGYAGLDEFHQMLTGGRTPLFQDVVLDSAGALTAGVICFVVIWVKKNHKKK